MICPTCGSVSTIPEIRLTENEIFYCCCCGCHFIGEKSVKEWK